MGNFRLAAIAAAALLATVAATAQDDKKDVQSAAAAAAAAFAQTPEPEVKAPKPVYWTKSAQTDLKFNQQRLSNWAAGGVNNVTLNAYIRGTANYAKGKAYWNNNLQCDYGFIYQQDKPFIQKNVDRLYIESKYGYRKNEKFGLSSKFDLLSQFSNTYNYVYPAGVEDPTAKDWKNARSIRSGLLSPAYAHLGVGVDWVPNPKNRWIVVNFQPLTGGFTIVSNEELRRAYGLRRQKQYADEGAYPYSETKEDGTVVNHGEYYRLSKFELGAQLQVDLNVRVNNNFTYSSTLIMFSDYLDNPQNMRVNFTNRVNWLLAKHLTMSFTSFLIYDDHVMIKSEKDLEKYPDGRQRIQLQELLGLGFTYTFPIAKK
ncbi:MAG: DUF3078 domain-containing protein [Bacteroidales bacterium]|nr:DUF3078 domain-containing protein [Bacteroidales bacterium]